ncbi:unnamed protein product [Effrenium voratum]|nr:unnamed protein product [Effrenium voratum]
MGRPGLSEGLTRKLMAEVLLALEYLHDELDVVFRDLKPENIVLDAALPMPQRKRRAAHGASWALLLKRVTPLARRYSPAVDIYTLGLVCLACHGPSWDLASWTSDLAWRSCAEAPPAFRGPQPRTRCSEAPPASCVRASARYRRPELRKSRLQRASRAEVATPSSPNRRTARAWPISTTGPAPRRLDASTPRRLDASTPRRLDALRTAEVAVLPSMVEEEPLSPGSVATEARHESFFIALHRFAFFALS